MCRSIILAITVFILLITYLLCIIHFQINVITLYTTQQLVYHSNI